MSSGSQSTGNLTLIIGNETFFYNNFPKNNTLKIVIKCLRYQKIGKITKKIGKHCSYHTENTIKYINGLEKAKACQTINQTWGLGFVQDLVLILTPPPHSTLGLMISPEVSLIFTQSVSNLDHGDHPPWMVTDWPLGGDQLLTKTVKKPLNIAYFTEKRCKFC